jgi:hypothetical protein
MEKASSSVILNATNYHGWSKQAMITLQGRGYKKFIEYSTYALWSQENGIVEEQQIRYNRLRKKIQDNAKLSEEQMVEQLDALDDKFHADLGRWSAAKAKNLENWNRDEEMCVALILSLVNDS